MGFPWQNSAIWTSFPDSSAADYRVLSCNLKDSVKGLICSKGLLHPSPRGRIPETPTYTGFIKKCGESRHFQKEVLGVRTYMMGDLQVKPYKISSHGNNRWEHEERN